MGDITDNWRAGILTQNPKIEAIFKLDFTRKILSFLRLKLGFRLGVSFFKMPRQFPTYFIDFSPDFPRFAEIQAFGVLYSAAT